MKISMEVGVIAFMRYHKMINGSKLLFFSSRSCDFGIEDFFGQAGRPGGSRDPPRRPTQGSGNDGNDGNDDDGNGNDDGNEHPDANHPTCPRAQG